MSAGSIPSSQAENRDSSGYLERCPNTFRKPSQPASSPATSPSISEGPASGKGLVPGARQDVPEENAVKGVWSENKAKVAEELYRPGARGAETGASFDPCPDGQALSLPFNHRLDLRISITLQILNNLLGVALSIHAAKQSWFRREMGLQTLEEFLDFDRAA